MARVAIQEGVIERMFFAYLDPGTGSAIIQVLIGAAVGIAVLVKAYWHRIRGMFSGQKQASKDLRKGGTKSGS